MPAVHQWFVLLLPKLTWLYGWWSAGFVDPITEQCAFPTLPPPLYVQLNCSEVLGNMTPFAQHWKAALFLSGYADLSNVTRLEYLCTTWPLFQVMVLGTILFVILGIARAMNHCCPLCCI